MAVEGPFPKYIQDHIEDSIRYGVSRHFESHPRPKFTFQDVLNHFVDPSYWAAGALVAQQAPGRTSRQSYGKRYTISTQPGQEQPWETTFTIQLPSTCKFIWPEKMNRPWPEISEGELIVAINDWAIFRAKVGQEWALVEGVIKAMQLSDMPLTAVKSLWPDFDLLLTKQPGMNRSQSGGNKIANWCKRFRELGRPRGIFAPFAGFRTYLEQARATVLASILVEPIPWEATSDDIYCTLHEHNRRRDMPWKASGSPQSVISRL